MVRIKIGLSLLVGLMLTTTEIIQAQTKKEAADTYNLGVAAQTNNNLDSAIIYFSKSIEIATKVGEDASDVLAAASSQLPGVYYKKATIAYKAKEYSEAIKLGKQTIAVAEQYNNNSKKSAGQVLLKLSYYAFGNNLSKQADYQKAIMNYDSALLIDPSYNKAYYSKAICYSKADEGDKLASTVDTILVMVKTDSTIIKNSKILAYDYFLNKGKGLNQANKLNDALQQFALAQKYGTDKFLMYYYSTIYNKLKKYDEAIASAQKGLELEMGTPEAKSMFYYEIALAQVGKGNTDDACEAFKNASLGNSFSAACKAQMTNLKCPGATPAPTK